MYNTKSGDSVNVDVASRLLSSNYVKNTSTGLQFRRQMCDGIQFNTESRNQIQFQNILRVGYIKKLQVVCRPYIAAIAAPDTPLVGLNLGLADTLKTAVTGCQVFMNGEPVVSETNLESYFSICNQINGERFEDESLDVCQYAPDNGAGTANVSLASSQNAADIKYERQVRGALLGSYAQTGVNVKNPSNSKAERCVLFDLDDILCVKGNYIPAMLLDQFAIHLQLTNSKRLLVPVDMEAAAANEQTTSMLVLDNVEIFVWYYPCSLDDVRAIRLAAQTLESSGVNSYGISFLTKRISGLV